MTFQIKEKSHQEKHTENIDENVLSQGKFNLIEENDTIFGTWNNNRVTGSINRTESLTVITNCFPVFQILFEKRSLNFKSLLIRWRNERTY